MINVVAINSSKRKMNTYGLIIQIKNILESKDISVEIINLYDYKIYDCIGCETCILTDKCCIKDDVNIILDKIKKSDGVILTSPVYLQGVSGKIKTLFDRTCSWYHRPKVYGKPFLVVSTTKGSGLKNTIDYLESVIIQWGGITAGSIGRNIRNIDKEVTEKECDKFIKLLNTNKVNHKPSLKSIMNFQVQKALSYHLMGLDSEYWKDKNWHKQIYYYNCKIHVVKRIIANSTFKLMAKGMKINIK